MTDIARPARDADHPSVSVQSGRASPLSDHDPVTAWPTIGRMPLSFRNRVMRLLLAVAENTKLSQKKRRVALAEIQNILKAEHELKIYGTVKAKRKEEQVRAERAAKMQAKIERRRLQILAKGKEIKAAAKPPVRPVNSSGNPLGV